MKATYRIGTLLVLVATLMMVTGVYGVLAHPRIDSYEDVVGKELTDSNVAEFLATNQCHALNAYYLCDMEGVSIWVKDNVVTDAFLYPGGDHGFDVYHNSKLPHRLSFKDTMADVEKKLGTPVSFYAPQAGWTAGMPDRSGTVGYSYYWAMYDRFGVTVIYETNSSADKAAKIHAVVITKDGVVP